MRIAEKKDIEELSKLRIAQQKEDWDEEYPEGEDERLYEVTKKYLIKHLNEDIIFFIEEQENHIIATCGLQIITYMPQCVESGKEGYICNVFTLREYRRKGIQTKLIDECIKFAKKQNLEILTLSSDNPEAISIYKKFGFERDTLIMQYYIKQEEKDVK